MSDPQKPLLLLNMEKWEKNKLSSLWEQGIVWKSRCTWKRWKSQPEGIQVIRLQCKWAIRTNQDRKKMTQHSTCESLGWTFTKCSKIYKMSNLNILFIKAIWTHKQATPQSMKPMHLKKKSNGRGRKVCCHHEKPRLFAYSKGTQSNMGSIRRCGSQIWRRSLPSFFNFCFYSKGILLSPPEKSSLFLVPRLYQSSLENRHPLRSD